MKLAELDDLMCAALRGEGAVWPAALGDGLGELVIERAEYQGVTALLYEHLPRLSTWPQPVRDTIRRRAVAETCWELFHQNALKEAVTALRTNSIEPVFFKGTALAYGIYGNPVWRPRGDTDIIVPHRERSHAAEVLISMGFQRNMGVSGEFVSYQDSYTKKIEDTGRHTIDLHCRINNSELLAGLLSYEELRAEARPLPQLCEGTLAVGPVHALLLACLHPATHRHNPYIVNGVTYYGGDRLIWHYDVHLLAQSFTRNQWQDFVDRAAAKGLCAISLEGLERATACYNTQCPDFVRQALAKTGEPVATYLKAGRLRQSWIDFSAIPSFTNRVRFVRELVFPSKAYMRAKYRQSSDTWLPWLYARRAAGGLIKRVRHADQDR